VSEDREEDEPAEEGPLVLDLGIAPPRARRGNPAVADLSKRSWPLQDLLREADTDLAQLAERLNVDLTTVWRRVEWGLTDEESDRWAIACGLHPVAVWGVAWVEAAEHRPETPTLFEGL
jgi:hypothetical protein